MHKDELRQLLTDFTAERLAILQRHEASARVVSHYDFNNTYQYVIAREEVHVRWLADAIADVGAEPEEVPEPTIAVPGKGEASQSSIITQDRDAAQAPQIEETSLDFSCTAPPAAFHPVAPVR